jgi:hypothetical protein
MEILNFSNINTKFINSYVIYPSIIENKTIYTNINTKIKENMYKSEKAINFVKDIINQYNNNDDDKYSLSFLISNNNKLGIFLTHIRDIFLDINNLKDMTLSYIKTLYKNFYNRFYNNIKYKDKQIPILDLVLKKEYNVPNDLYYINNFFFYRSFPIFNYLLCKHKNIIISDNDNKFDYNHIKDIKLLENVLFDMIYTNDDIDIYKKNITNLLNSNSDIFDYIIFEERVDIGFGNIDIDSLYNIEYKNMSDIATIDFLLIYILNYIFNNEYGINNNFNNIKFFKNETVNNFLKKLINEKNNDVLYYLLYISHIVFYFDFFKHIYNSILESNNSENVKQNKLNKMNKFLFISSETALKNEYKEYFKPSTIGLHYCAAVYKLGILENVPTNIKKFFNTLKFIDNIKNSQQSTLLIFLSFSNTKIRFLMSDEKKNTLLNELLNLHEFEKYAIIYSQKKL